MQSRKKWYLGLLGVGAVAFVALYGLNAAHIGGFTWLVIGFYYLALWTLYTGKLPRVVETPHPSADFELEDEFQRLLDKSRNGE